MESTVLITGASGGIGRALARQFHSQSLRVAVVGSFTTVRPLVR
jgi:NAD(P)-dependent dehydrogenase (short-subunit alcohol dehydrogenase family)